MVTRMDELISRQAAIDICTSAIDLWSGQLGEGALVAVRDRIAGLPSAPTIDTVKHGLWERHYSSPNVFADLYWHCSECGYKNGNQWANRYHKFCPNCGALMDQEADHDDHL